MAGRSPDPTPVVSARERASLCEALDRVLNKGAVVVGEVTISVADIDLIYLGLQVVLTSIETGRRLAIGPCGKADSAITEATDGRR
ncbi:MAG: gas vesicle protein [candidate division NC10 bacterium]